MFETIVTNSSHIGERWCQQHETLAEASAWVTDNGAAGTFGTGYTVIGPTDISAQVAYEENLKARRVKRFYGEMVLDVFAASLEADEVSNADSMTIMATYSDIIAALKLGSLEIARAMAVAVEPTELITETMITQFVALIDSYEE